MRFLHFSKRTVHILLAIAALACIPFFSGLLNDARNTPNAAHLREITTPISNINLALNASITASSNNAAAQILLEGQEMPNASWHTSWSPAQIPARPSWVLIDLGKKQPIQRLAIIFSVAAYDGIYDIWAPPNQIDIEMGEDSEKLYKIKTISQDKIPEQGAEATERRLEINLDKIQEARFVKLVFPKGGKLKSMPDVVGLGSIAIYAPPSSIIRNTAKSDNIAISKESLISNEPTIAMMEGLFGRITVDLKNPKLISLFLREDTGELAKKSLLALHIRGLTKFEAKNPKIFQRQGAYTYVSDKNGNRFQSLHSSTHQSSIEKDELGRIKKIKIMGIRPTTSMGLPGPLQEDWTLEQDKDNLIWTIQQHWQENFTADISGTPAIHLARFGGVGAYRDHRIDLNDPAITSTLWIKPEFLNSGTHPDYETYDMEAATPFRTHTLNRPNTWAIYKFFTNFHLPVDLRLSVDGGYLYRRAGVRNDFNEIGATAVSKHTFAHKAGERSTVKLTISSVNKFTTGQQMHVNIPDKALLAQLQDLYSSILNGGIISDPKRYHFGNGTEDVNYAGSAGFQAKALSIGFHEGHLAEAEYNADQAFRGHLEQILQTMNSQGLCCFGFNAKGQLLDDNLHLVSAAKTYAVKTSDQAFIRQHYDQFAKTIQFFIDNIDAHNGLFRSPEKGAHWYYDGIGYSGYNTYYQAFLYRALLDMAEMSEMIGKFKDAQIYTTKANLLAQAINQVLWDPDAPEGPRYADWIDENGQKARYFIDIVQYPLIAFGIANEERSKAMLHTADNRLQKLKKQYGHTRSASLSLLWPISPSRGERCFGTYFYGGSLPSSTYWEVVARARMHNIEGEWGAYTLLKNFAQRFHETSFVGSNALDIRGNICLGGDEGYLADMVVVPAALIHGLLGIDLGTKEIKVNPNLPAHWKHVQTRLMWMGELYDITIEGKKVTISKQ